MTEKEKIGFVGCGKMGNPMAKRLINAGYSLIAYDLIEERTKELVAMGALAADSLKSVAIRTEVIITMIPDDPAIEAVALGKEGILEVAQEGKILIDMSTISPMASSRVAEVAKKKGVKYLRTTVSGSPKFAEAGILTIFISGPEEVYQKCHAILGTLGQKLFYLGTGEEARYLKLLINMIVGTTAMIVAEALTFGEKGGVDWIKMLEGLGGSVVASPLIGYKVQPLKERKLPPTFTVSQIAKDFDLALATGKALSVPMPITSTVSQFLEMMKATGRGELDAWSVVFLMEELAGLKKPS
jgi:3-hydroxyisobutyrate dehydrogenase-like beta-hydroxyacid dehydrogenase